MRGMANRWTSCRSSRGKCASNLQLISRRLYTASLRGVARWQLATSQHRSRGGSYAVSAQRVGTVLWPPSVTSVDKLPCVKRAERSDQADQAMAARSRIMVIQTSRARRRLRMRSASRLVFPAASSRPTYSCVMLS